MKTSIRFRERYSGWADSILVRDGLRKGELGPYDILDDEGHAYVLNQANAEVKVEHVEGKLVHPSMFRIASFPQINVEDDLYLARDLAQHAREVSEDAIHEQEDHRLFSLLDAANQDYAEDSAKRNHDPKLRSYLSKSGTLRVIAQLKNNFLSPCVFICNPVNEAAFRKFVSPVYPAYSVSTSPICPEGLSFITPPPAYLGVMPTFGFSEIANPTPEQFREGWVLSELIGMLILNPKGVGVLETR